MVDSGYTSGNPSSKLATSAQTQFKVPALPRSISAEYFAVGQNDDGQLGIDNREDYDGIMCTQNFKKIAIPDSVEFSVVSCGSMHTVAIDEDGRLWSWGAKEYTGRDALEFEPTMLVNESNAKFVRCAISETATVALDDNGQVWSWGFFRTNKGDYFFNGLTENQRTPAKLSPQLPEPCVAIACGESHVLALTISGQIFGWGSNEHSQLGQLDVEPVVLRPTKVNIPSGFKVTAVYACGNSSFLAGEWENGEKGLLGCGLNFYGELGVGEVGKVVSFQEISTFRGQTVVEIAGGLHHTLFLTSRGELYGAGLNESGQLGIGDTVTTTPSPIKIQVDQVASISCGRSSDHSYLITVDGTLWTFGFNVYGQLGLKHSEDVSTPSMSPLKGRRALHVVGGAHFTILKATKKD
ncbi:Regulator of chromosome condensation [Chytridiales sp. JEL 0842]|nr:Regulator of chromosome condensation [Chytridiales sp. JEL 0842]